MSTVQFTIYRHEGPLMLPKIHEGSISACYMSHDRQLLVSAGYDLNVILWDIENMIDKLVLRVRRIFVFSCVYQMMIGFLYRVIEIG
jgi:hypothetical protein